MIAPPTAYLRSLFGEQRETSTLTAAVCALMKSGQPIHFIQPFEELDFAEVFAACLFRMQQAPDELPELAVGMRLIHYNRLDDLYILRSKTPSIRLESKEGANRILTNVQLKEYIPLSGATHSQPGAVAKHFRGFAHVFGAQIPPDFYNLQRLLVVGNQSLFQKLPNSIPACFVHEVDGHIQINYNSAVMPKVVVIKDLRLLDEYLENEDFGQRISFGGCLVVGDAVARHCINLIRNHHHQGRFESITFFTERDEQIELGNNSPLYRWKWTVPELNYFKQRKVDEPSMMNVSNEALDAGISRFYEDVQELESQFGVNLKAVYQHIRRLYFNWVPDSVSNRFRLQKLLDDFKTAALELLQDVLLDAHPDVDCPAHAGRLIVLFEKLTTSLQKSNKAMAVAALTTLPQRIIAPSFLTSAYAEFYKQQTQRLAQKQPSRTVRSLQALSTLGLSSTNTQTQNAEGESNSAKSPIVSSLSRCEPDAQKDGLVTSIYGLGGVDRLIEYLCEAEGKHSLLLYTHEAAAWQYHLGRYKERLAAEYESEDRKTICGVTFSDPYFYCATYDHFLEALIPSAGGQTSVEKYWLMLSGKQRIKLPGSRKVLRITNSKKEPVRVDDLGVGDKVLIYANPDSQIVSRIVGERHPELVERVRVYSELWRQSFLDYYVTNSFATPEAIYAALKQNRFSVSIDSMLKYLKIDHEIFFPRSKADLIAIAKTIGDKRLNLNMLKNGLFPDVRDYDGKLVEAGVQLSEAINELILTGQKNKFLTENLTAVETASILSQLPERTIQDIELADARNHPHE